MRADDPLVELATRIAACTACPRLVDARHAVAGDGYWARPVPGFGDPHARIHVLGLATAPHGGNRFGRAFTGNRSAGTLVAALHRAGLASQPTSRHRGDGLLLRSTWMASAVRCPPPDHRPTRAERDQCLGWLTAEVELLPDLRVILCLGRTAWESACDWAGVRPRPRFGHGSEHITVAGPQPGLVLVGSYHPSPQNTRSGLLTATMLDDVFRRARTLAALDDLDHAGEPA